MKQADIILFNYMISDFAKYASKYIVTNFLLTLKEKLSRENPNTIILFNDINLDFPFNTNKGATHLLKDCFEPTYKRVFKQFYKNNKKPLEKQFSYEGTTPMNENNSLIFNLSQDTINFNPYTSMSAIQIILKR